jgi:hypothetical protein
MPLPVWLVSAGVIVGLAAGAVTLREWLTNQIGFEDLLEAAHRNNPQRVRNGVPGICPGYTIFTTQPPTDRNCIYVYCEFTPVYTTYWQIRRVVNGQHYEPTTLNVPELRGILRRENLISQHQRTTGSSREA